MATAVLPCPEPVDCASASAAASQHRAVSWIEVLIVPCLIMVQVLLLGDPLPFQRSFWLDEIHTQLVTEDPSLAHALSALAHGVDFNPPTYYLLAKGVSHLGISPEIAQRSLALICILLCCVCTYLLLRDRCTIVTATAATLVIWSLNVIQTQAFEARFYAPWLAAGGLFGLCLQRCSQSPSIRWRVGLAVSSLLMCSLHYFGVISLGLIVAGFLAQHFTTRLGRLSDLLWITPGPLALGLCVACFYRGQRSALSIPTWVPALSWTTFQEFAGEALPTWAVGVSLLAWCGTWLIRQRFQEVDHQHTVSDRQAPTIETPNTKLYLPAAGALALMPVCLIIFSLILQPALVARYATIGAIGFAIVIAALLRQCPTWVSFAIGSWLFVMGFQSLTEQFHYWQRMELRHEEIMARLRGLDSDVPLIFESRHAMYPVLRYAPDLAPRIHYLALTDKNLRDFDSATPFRIVERDVAARIASYYPQYRTIPFDQLHLLPRAYLFAFRQRKDFGKQLEAFEVTRRSPQLYEIVPRIARRPSTATAARNARLDTDTSDAARPVTAIE